MEFYALRDFGWKRSVVLVTFQAMKRLSVTLSEMEPSIANEVLAMALRDAHQHRPFPATLLRGEFQIWAGVLIDALRGYKARLAYVGEVVKLPPQKQPMYPTYLPEVGAPKRTSTKSLRQHVFAVYASAMAYHGAEAAFDAAVTETLRRTRNWNLELAVAHTRKFIVPAYEAAFGSI